jgi:DNA-3-methyladenine glycosylase I
MRLHLGSSVGPGEFRVGVRRCEWAAAGTELDIRYHDEEWGVPVHDDRVLFEFLVLEGAQAGLSWSTILNKREGYRRAFADFDPERVARFNRRSVERLLANPEIVRNRLKIESTISNARAFLEVRQEHGSFDAFVWTFVDGSPLQNCFRTRGDLPGSTELSHRLSRELKRRGFRFVGSTICYAFMQAIGMVNDHTVDCFRHDAVAALG